MKHICLIALISLCFAGCASKPEPAPVPPPEPVVTAPPPVEEVKEAPSTAKGVEQLAKGLKSYENGNYKVARKLLQSALEAGLNSTDQVLAYKHLAFVTCAAGQKELCKGHCRKVLAIDPGFELDRKEAGHPTWGKIFRAVKAEKPATTK